MGKSALVTNIAENVALKANKPVALFSLEMSVTELAQRFVASQARMPGDKLRKGQVARNDWPKVLKACQALERAPLWIDDSSDLDVLELRAKARRLHAKEIQQGRGGLGLVIVDYLQLMRADPSADSRVEQVGQMSRGLKILARELEVPVIAVSQLNRSPEQRPDKRPLLSDLRESGPDRAGRGPRDVHLPRRVLQPGDREAGRGRDQHRQAPQRPGRHARGAVVPVAVPEVREHRPRRAAVPSRRRAGRRGRADGRQEAWE